MNLWPFVTALCWWCATNTTTHPPPPPGAGITVTDLQVTDILNVPHGATLPKTCSVGDFWLLTADGTSYRCTATNTWTSGGSASFYDLYVTNEFRVPSGPVTPATCNASDIWFNSGSGIFYSCNGFPANTWRALSLYSLMQVNGDGFFSGVTGINFKDGTSSAPVHFTDDGSGNLLANVDANPTFNAVGTAVMNVYYVSASHGNDAWIGSALKPFATVDHALSVANTTATTSAWSVVYLYPDVYPSTDFTFITGWTLLRCMHVRPINSNGGGGCRMGTPSIAADYGVYGLNRRFEIDGLSFTNSSITLDLSLTTSSLTYYIKSIDFGSGSFFVLNSASVNFGWFVGAWSTSGGISFPVGGSLAIVNCMLGSGSVPAFTANASVCNVGAQIYGLALNSVTTPVSITATGSFTGSVSMAGCSRRAGGSAGALTGSNILASSSVDASCYGTSGFILSGGAPTPILQTNVGALQVDGSSPASTSFGTARTASAHSGDLTYTISTAAATACNSAMPTTNITNTLMTSATLCRVFLTQQSYSGNGSPRVQVMARAVGSWLMGICNMDATNALSGTIVVGYKLECTS